MIMNSQKALEYLIDGNHRYVGGRMKVPADLSLERDALIATQAPYVAMVCCSDSRVPPEIIFDAGLGHLFVARTAGNTVCDLVIGSMEFAVDMWKAPLLVVMGHTGCLAVETAASGKVLESHMQTVLNAIVPGIDENIRHGVAALGKSPVLSRAVSEGTLKIIGAKYDMETGAVEFWD